MDLPYRFGRFELNPATRELRVEGQAAALGSRAFDVLLALVERRERLVTKDELLELAWPGVVVEENNLQVQISALRKLLGPRAIATIAGRGYRFALVLDTATGAASAVAPLTGTPPHAPARAATPHNLPSELDTFIGRERDLAAVLSMLRREDVRLVTLTGPGGTGKTRLSLKVAAALLEEYPQGVFWVDLAPIADAEQVIPRIAATLQVKEAAGKTLIESLIEHLRARQILLVLDNFEQVIRAAPQVTSLLAGAPKLKVLVTSRETLHVRGENDFAVQPLSVPDAAHRKTVAVISQYEAAALFIHRAKAASHTWEIDEGNATAVAEICARLDGLPLAIELAAARSRMLAPQAMLEKLANRLQTLTGGPRDLPARQQTIRDTIEWSYDLLEDRDKTLFARLGVFVGGWSAEAAQAVCGASVAPAQALDEDQVLAGLESLLDKNLIRQDAAGRYSMLETIREFSLEHLQRSGAEPLLQHLHCRHFLNLAEAAAAELSGPQASAWNARLELEQHNAQAAIERAIHANDAPSALRLCTALTEYWRNRGDRLGIGLFKGALALADDVDIATKAAALGARGWLGFGLENATRMIEYMERSTKLWRQAGNPLQAALMRMKMGVLHFPPGEYEKGSECIRESLEVFRTLDGQDEAVAQALIWLVHFAVGQEDYEAAARYLDEAIAIARNLNSPSLLAHATWISGHLASSRGNPAQALSAHKEAMRLFTQIGDRAGATITMPLVAEAALRLGKLDEAHAWLRQSLQSLAEVKNTNHAGHTLLFVARYALVSERHDVAARLFGASETQFALGAYRLPPARHRERESNLAVLRERLGEAAFDAAISEGRAKSLEDAIVLAWEVLGQ